MIDVFVYEMHWIGLKQVSYSTTFKKKATQFSIEHGLKSPFGHLSFLPGVEIH